MSGEVLFENVSKAYEKGGEKAVSGFNLQVKGGEFAVLVGPSGCGKSTTLRMLAGLESVSEGKISIDGRDVTNIPPKDRDIAMVFQNYALYPHMTVRENMAFALKLRKFDKREIASRVENVAERLGLAEYMDRFPKALSGGQRQRVALARAIVRKPAVFLFDEPLSNLDAKMRVDMRAEIIKLHRELGTTMIYVTHDQVEAMTMGSRIVVMNKGRIEQVAPPREIYSRPATIFVATFIGTPPMNILKDENGRTFGIRPEDVYLTDGETGRIEFAEALGSETILHIELPNGDKVAVRQRGYCTIEAGASTGLRFDMAKAVYFDGNK
ncbi:MAG: ABC transporter ATP-binding protein [Kiritimatiellae bacterium]|nr:ABC transporter ATP-binding protein [Kiritimatiellia bacterium]